MAISDWDITASNNTNIDGVNIAENCPPGGINNAIRSIMAAVRSAISDFWLTVLTASTASAARAAMGVPEATAAATALGSVTPAANTLPYFTGANSASVTTLSSFMRTMLDDADAATARATIGALAAGRSGSGTSGRYVFSDGFAITWRTFTFTGGSATLTYGNSHEFSVFARAWVEGDDVGGQDVSIWVTSSGLSSATVRNGGDSGTITCTLFALGV